MKNLTRCAVLLVVLMVLVTTPIFSGGEQEKGEVVLTWPSIWVGQDSKAGIIEELVNEFNSEHEGEIRVVIEPQPDYDGYEDKIRTSLATGQVPDIFTFKLNPTTAKYYDSDLLLDFTEELEKGGWKDNFNKVNLDKSTINGRTKTLPYEIAITPIWYNSRLFEEAGIDGFPKTMDEFWDAAEKLKAIGVVPTSQMTGGANAWTSMLWYCHLVASYGGPDIWEKRWDDPAFAKAAAIIKRFYSNGNTTSDAIGGVADTSTSHYFAERTAIYVNGPWMIGRIKRDAPDVYEVSKIAPAPKAGEHYGHQAGWLHTSIAAANTDDPRRKEAVLTFLRYLTAPENAKRVSLAAGSLLAIDFELGPDDDVDPLQKEFIEAKSNAKFLIEHMESALSVDVVNEVGQAIGAMALKDASPEEFVQMLEDAERE